MILIFLLFQFSHSFISISIINPNGFRVWIVLLLSFLESVFPCVPPPSPQCQLIHNTIPFHYQVCGQCELELELNEIYGQPFHFRQINPLILSFLMVWNCTIFNFLNSTIHQHFEYWFLFFLLYPRFNIDIGFVLSSNR